MMSRYAVLAFAPVLALGQAGTRPRLEVASVKPSDPSSRIRMDFSPGKAVVTHARVKDLLPLAYGFQPFLISGGPEWFGTDHYDIVGELAVQSGAPPTRLQTLDALQVFLEDRFKLRIHRESKSLPHYKLTIAKGGFKPKDGDELPEGTAAGLVHQTESRLVRKKAPLSSLVTALAGNLGCQVEDLTGLQGLYSFVLEWQYDEPGGDGFEFAMIAALRSQRGLSLERSKGPVTVLVIDSAERPAAS
jgi:uncharacterized protein (TIGR03435 family)